MAFGPRLGAVSLQRPSGATATIRQAGPAASQALVPGGPEWTALRALAVSGWPILARPPPVGPGCPGRLRHHLPGECSCGLSHGREGMHVSLLLVGPEGFGKDGCRRDQ